MTIRHFALAAILLLAACERSEAPSSVEREVPQTQVPAPAPPADAGQPAPPPVTAPASTEPRSPDAIPPAFLGRWGRSTADCSRPHDLELTVATDRLRFWESEARVERVTAAGDRAIRVAGRFTGEGESWAATNRLALSEDGTRLTVAGAGQPVTRVRCG